MTDLFDFLVTDLRLWVSEFDLQHTKLWTDDIEFNYKTDKWKGVRLTVRVKDKNKVVQQEKKCLVKDIKGLFQS